ncbi:glucose-6-phosphate dehydrogenase [Convivina praedatoris]|uniref:Glucose-6-phosphate 1-dehydrogenase n=1 Tax=Convivina praedatoris TaxID=2880963 RepID=A0ABN8HA91_9LACO|nr:glucose-6-phosphate dehydrogenase [Convivina sp. LMG 32447]CAH1855579.1 Glucose-6-phosphate 1-dehydrogenase [Convivina sp. LMG 32447]CAH1856330.1 Glucose-6-phosphate 1-dehydrogenase [Convivina sp. LMG 32447]CAH1856624.1 Glucose-6-phosphate 1-dehydrogenase [Convivina sp. LMG 32447]
MVSEIKTLVTFFGATGDLAKRMLYPSVFNLYKKGYLQNNFAIVGTSRQELSTEEYQEMVRQSIQAGVTNQDQAEAFIKHFSYNASDVTEAAGYAGLRETIEAAAKKFGVEGNRIFYMSVAPRFFGTIAQYLKSEGLLADKGFNRLMIEKPFGSSYATAEKLQNELENAFEDDQLYRIDHFLGKEMVLNIAPLRFGNPLIANAWNKDYIKNIQVTLAETLGVEERAGYYDTAGALLDMIQNHAMQIVGWLAMEEPASFSDKDIRAAKNAAFSALKIYDEAEVNRYFVRGQYGENGEYAAYNKEPDVPADSKNNTYIAGELQFDMPRWQGVPFYVRSGKRMTTKTTRIDVVFKAGTFAMGAQQEPQETVLSIIVSPDASIQMSLNAKDVADTFSTHLINLDWQPTAQETAETPAPYERMIHDAMDGDGSNFADWHGVATAWKFTDAISDVYAADKAPLEIYPAGSMGPEAADELLAKNGDNWILK